MFTMHAASAYSFASVCTPLNGGEHVMLQQLVHGRAHWYLLSTSACLLLVEAPGRAAECMGGRWKHIFEHAQSHHTNTHQSALLIVLVSMARLGVRFLGM